MDASRNTEWNTLVSRVCCPDLTATLVRAIAAEKRQENVADTLRDQLLVGIELLSLHARGGSAAKQTFDHTERSDRHDWREQIPEHGKVQALEIEPVGKKQRAGNVADGGERIHAEHARDDRRGNDADERAGDALAPLFRPEDHNGDDEKSDQRRLPVHRKAEPPVGEQLFHVGKPLGGRAEEIVDLPEGDNDGNAGRKAHDDGHRDKADETPELEDSGEQQQHAGGKAGEEHALQTVRGDDADQHRAHRAGGTGNLERRAAEQRDHDTGDDRRDESCRRRSAGRNAERQRKRQRHRAHGKPGEDVLQELFRVVAGKLSL